MNQQATTRRPDSLVLLLVLTVLTTVTAAGPLASGASASTDNVATRWVQRALSAVKGGSPSSQTSTPAAGRVYAMTTSAMYDAVNGIDTADGTSSRGRAVVASSSGAPAGASREAAASAAAHAVLTTLFPGLAGTLNSAHEGELALLGSDPSVEAGRLWGKSVGDEVVSARSTDGTQMSQSQPGGSGAGVFPRTFSGAQFRNMTPFGVAATAPYLSSGPPALSSDDYAEDFNEVKSIGSSADTDPERAAIAKHWLAESGTVRETGLWFKAALQVVGQEGTSASLSDTVRLFALLGMAIADSVAVAWADKHDNHFWRPGDAIRQADIDGNPATEQDTAWNQRGGTCPAGAAPVACPFGGTPEHTSGTSMFAGSASSVLAAFYCTDHVAFSFAGESGVSPRSYKGFKDAAKEAGRSRIYGGIHFQFSNEAGQEAGKKIAREIVRTRLVPEDSGPGASSVCKTGKSK